MGALDSHVPDKVLFATWGRCIGHWVLEGTPVIVDDPADAVRALAARLGWQWPNWHVLHDPSGYMLDLRVEAPLKVARAAEEAYDRRAASRSSLAEDIRGPPDLGALCAVCHSTHTSEKVFGRLRAMIEGLWPSQASLHAAGLADSPLRKCREEGAPSTADFGNARDKPS